MTSELHYVTPQRAISGVPSLSTGTIISITAMPQSPASENNTAMGATAPGQGIKGENVSDASQRKGYFGGGTQGHKSQAGEAISKGVIAAEESVSRTTEKYWADKKRRF